MSAPARPLPPPLLRGDCVARMRDLPDDSVDAIVTDPPYGLDFMGKDWDRYTPADFGAWCQVWATEALRVLKPGGHLLAFGGSRTWHRLAAGIEDAGFEVRDSIAWLYAGRFVTGDRLKPSHEPIVIAKKEGPPGLRLSAVRIGDEVRVNAPAGNLEGGASLNMSARGMPSGAEPREVRGRWAPNAIVDDAVAGDLGGASRFFYVAKAPKSERPVVVDEITGERTAHPTVKPLALMRWLVRLVTPEGGVVLDPFAGSGTTLEAAHLEGFEAIGVELTPEYWPLIESRIERAIEARAKGGDRA